MMKGMVKSNKIGKSAAKFLVNRKTFNDYNRLP